MNLKKGEPDVREVDFENENVKKKKSGKKILKFFIAHKKITIVCIAAFVVILIALSISIPGRVTTISESTLKEMINVSDLSTAEYVYNSIATVSENDKPRYYVAYNGTVKLGFDFNKLKVTDDKKNHKIYIDLPDIKINSVNVDESSMEFIFEKEVYNKENTYQEAYRKSVEDLSEKAKNNKSLLKVAKESEVAAIEALIAPWKAELPKNYEIEYR